AERGRIGARSHVFDQLLGAERDQHADHDHPDFPEKLPPAVHRLGQMEMHAVRPPRLPKLPDAASSAMGRRRWLTGTTRSHPNLTRCNARLTHARDSLCKLSMTHRQLHMTGTRS